MNIPAILGLKKALEYIQSVGINEIYEKEMELTSAFISMAQKLEGVHIIGKKDISDRVAVVSLDFPESDNAAIATMLDEKYNIMTRCGLHCAPSAHKTLNTYPHGTVRFSFGYFNTMDDVEYIIQSIKEITKEV
jgi:selenocysteine lyase/cysteine desulfurase